MLTKIINFNKEITTETDIKTNCPTDSNCNPSEKNKETCKCKKDK